MWVLVVDYTYSCLLIGIGDAAIGSSCSRFKAAGTEIWILGVPFNCYIIPTGERTHKLFYGMKPK